MTSIPLPPHRSRGEWRQIKRSKRQHGHFETDTQDQRGILWSYHYGTSLHPVSHFGLTRLDSHKHQVEWFIQSDVKNPYHHHQSSWTDGRTKHALIAFSSLYFVQISLLAHTWPIRRHGLLKSRLLGQLSVHTVLTVSAGPLPRWLYWPEKTTQNIESQSVDE